MKLLLMTVGIFSLCAASGSAPVQEQQDQNTQANNPPAHAKDFDWNKKFDASLETDPKRRKWARQYTALAPLVEQMTEFFKRERIDTFSYRKVRVKQLEIRCRLETDLNEKKKCLEILVYELKTLQEIAEFVFKEPARPGSAVQLGSGAIDDLVGVTLKKIEWESELDQINRQSGNKPAEK